MRLRAPAVAVFASAVSVALHASGLIVLAPAPPASLAGGPAQLAMIGNSFEDAAVGRFGPSEVTTEAEAVALPDLAPTSTPEATVAPAAPAPVIEAVRPQETARADVVTPTPAAADAAPVAVPNLPDLPAVVTAAPVEATTPAAPNPPEASARAEPDTQSPTAPPDRIVARDRPEPQTPDADTPRPQPRGERPAQTAETPPTRPERPAEVAPPAGAAAQAARAGEASGAPQGTATQTAQGGAAQSASDGRAIAAYPQQVNRHLGRLPRPSARFDGSAIIAFAVAPGGGLAAVQVAQSSGSAEFDRIALAHIQRAAPFPPPPPGAQRNFNVTVRGR